MKFDITQQQSYSRGELLLRTFFGWLYIMVPHTLVLFFVGIWSGILHFISWWVILFTGRYPASFFEFHVKMLAWTMRLNAVTWNLVDGYPAIGTAGSHPAVTLEVPYPESLSRAKLLLRAFFGVIYVTIPHGICLWFRMVATSFLNFVSWWSILFSGRIPANWFQFNVGTLRWMLRLNLYMANMTDDYPPFSGKPIPAAGQIEFEQQKARLLTPPQPPQPVEDRFLRALVPIGRTGLAVVAGYLGLFSIIPFVAPIALGISLWAIMDLRKRPNLSGRGRAYFGLVAGGICTLGWAAFLLLH